MIERYVFVKKTVKKSNTPHKSRLAPQASVIPLWERPNPDIWLSKLPQIEFNHFGRIKEEMEGTTL